MELAPVIRNVVMSYEQEIFSLGFLSAVLGIDQETLLKLCSAVENCLEQRNP